MNIQLFEEAWSQATLSEVKGGLGLRPATEVAIAGYLSSVHASSGIVQSLLPINVRGQQCNHYELALTTGFLWKEAWRPSPKWNTRFFFAFSKRTQLWLP